MTSADLIKKRQVAVHMESEGVKATPTSILDDLTAEAQARDRVPSETFGSGRMKYPEGFLRAPLVRDYYDMQSKGSSLPTVYNYGSSVGNGVISTLPMPPAPLKRTYAKRKYTPRAKPK